MTNLAGDQRMFEQKMVSDLDDGSDQIESDEEDPDDEDVSL